MSASGEETFTETGPGWHPDLGLPAQAPACGLYHGGLSQVRDHPGLSEASEHTLLSQCQLCFHSPCPQTTWLLCKWRPLVVCNEESKRGPLLRLGRGLTAEERVPAQGRSGRQYAEGLERFMKQLQSWGIAALGQGEYLVTVLSTQQEP